MKIRNRIKKFEEKNWIGFFSTRTKGMEFRRVRNILSLVHLQGIAQSIVNFRLYTLRSSSFFSWCNVKAILTSRKPFFFSFLSSFPTGCCSFLLLSLTVGLIFYSLPTFYTFSLSLSLHSLWKRHHYSSIIPLFSYTAAIARKMLPTFPVSLLYAHRWMYEFNNGEIASVSPRRVYFMEC